MRDSDNMECMVCLEPFEDDDSCVKLSLVEIEQGRWIVPDDIEMLCHDSCLVSDHGREALADRLGLPISQRKRRGKPRSRE